MNTRAIFTGLGVGGVLAVVHSTLLIGLFDGLSVAALGLSLLFLWKGVTGR